MSFADRRDGIDVEHVGEYLEIDRPRRLVFTFGVPQFSPEFTRVRVDIVPSGSAFELTLTHEGVLRDYASQTRQGWTGILEGLAAALRAAFGRAPQIPTRDGAIRRPLRAARQHFLRCRHLAPFERYRESFANTKVVGR